MPAKGESAAPLKPVIAFRQPARKPQPEPEVNVASETAEIFELLIQGMELYHESISNRLAQLEQFLPTRPKGA